jgi:predicted nucleotide-binding protein (sugar kinase/HSP70/actin superfamily)
MPFTFPHFGSLKYVFQSLLHELGRRDLIIPNKPNKRTKHLGSIHSPEFVCTPFKLTLGTFIESLDRGADELGMGGCNAYCRFGYYWPVQKLILQDLGYDFEFIPLNYESPKEIIDVCKNRISNGCNLLQTIRAFRITWLKNRLTDITDKMLFKYRAIEREKGASEELAETILQDIVELQGIRKIKKMERQIPKIFEKEIDYEEDADPLKLAVNGEIYVVIEPMMNLDVHKRLNEMGVIVDNPITLRRFIDVGKKLNPFTKLHFQISKKYAKPYVEHRVGGETQENLGDIIYYKKKNYDGIVHLYPFTCMPEIITRSIAPEMSKKYDMPFLSLVVDEHTGEAGFQTRLEAFVDLLYRKREKEREEQNRKNSK